MADTAQHQRNRGDATPPPPPPPCPVQSLAQFGQLAKDVLYGNRAEGLYGTAGASKFVISSTNGRGLSLTTTATSASGSSGPLSGQLLATFTHPSRTGGLVADLLVTSGGVAEATISHTFTLPAPAPAPAQDTGPEQALAPLRPPSKLMLGAVVSLPALAEKSQVLPPKVTLDYVGKYLHIKTSSALVVKPLITAAVVGGSGPVALGGEAAFSSSTRRVTRWSVATAWHDKKQNVGLQLSNNNGGGSSSDGGKVTLLYGHSLQPGVVLGLEAVADVKPAMKAFLVPPTAAAVGAGNGGGTSGGGGGKAGGNATRAAAAAVPPTFVIGATFKVPAKEAGTSNNGGGGRSGGGGGGVVKVKVSSRGLISVLYRDTLAAGPRVTFTAEMDGLNPGTRPRVGVQLEV